MQCQSTPISCEFNTSHKLVNIHHTPKQITTKKEERNKLNYHCKKLRQDSKAGKVGLPRLRKRDVTTRAALRSKVAMTCWRQQEPIVTADLEQEKPSVVPTISRDFVAVYWRCEGPSQKFCVQKWIWMIHN